MGDEETGEGIAAVMPFTFTPTPEQVAMWREYGGRRHDLAREMGGRFATYTGGADRSRIADKDTVGVAGEHAVAVWLGLPDWLPSLDTFMHTPDVSRYDVRCATRHTYRLIVRKGDIAERPYVHATVDKADWPTVNVWGWMLASEARQPRYERNPGEYEQAWFVPADDLNPVDTMPWEGAPWR